MVGVVSVIVCRDLARVEWEKAIEKDLDEERFLVATADLKKEEERSDFRPYRPEDRLHYMRGPGPRMA